MAPFAVACSVRPFVVIAKGKGGSGGKSGGHKVGPSTPMTSDAASRIQSAEARKNGGIVRKGTWAARAQARCPPTGWPNYTSLWLPDCKKSNFIGKNTYQAHFVVSDISVNEPCVTK